MPEYLTPGVYVEETSFRARSIQGVATSTTGMAGVTAYGPTPYRLELPSDTVVNQIPTPLLITSYAEYERAFGELGDVDGDTNYLGFAARAFFANGGQRLYIARVFPGLAADPLPDPATVRGLFATLPVGNPAVLTWHARWPGAAGGSIQVTTSFRRSGNVVVTEERNGQRVARLTGVAPGAAVEIGARNPDGTVQKIRDTVPPTGDIRIVAQDPQGTLGFQAADQSFQAVAADTVAFHITLGISVQLGDTPTALSGLELDPDGVNPRSVFTVAGPEDPADDLTPVWLELVAPAAAAPPVTPAIVLDAFLQLAAPTFGGSGPRYLAGGGDGGTPDADDLNGREADPDNVQKPATGLQALGEIDDIAIVATPDTARLAPLGQEQAVGNLLEHCEQLRYRVAIVDPPASDTSLSKIREFRATFDSTYGALYYPWVEIIDPTQRPDPGAPPPTLALPPSGYVAGIYARSDVERGVFKAPANEVVQGITDLTTNVTYGRQGVLNPEGINALRFFEGRSRRVWGARTMSSDPEWKYVNLRRLFVYLEHSIDRSTQWAVFEPNNERLWASIRRSIEDFLVVAWRDGALIGARREDAFFVRCDRTTMTQNDLDNGRLICLIGVAPTYPAEFVVFRIGQWTADAQSS